MKRLLSILLISFFLITCSKDKDPCEGIVCVNGGTCINGVCDCPEGYTGVACGDQDAPSKILISKITVTKFPATEDDGGGWDLTNGPDIYVTVELDGTNTTIGFSQFYKEDANPSVDYDLSPQNPIAITSINSRHSITLWDYDDIVDEFIGGVVFSPYSDTNGFPTEMTLDAGGKVAFTITLSYEF